MAYLLTSTRLDVRLLLNFRDRYVIGGFRDSGAAFGSGSDPFVGIRVSNSHLPNLVVLTSFLNHGL